MIENFKNILACIDSPDPDNFALVIGLQRLFPEAQINVMLTGRPIRFNAKKEHELWDYDMKSSVLAHEASAARIKNFLLHFDIEVIKVYDGGIAPRTLVPHWLHFADYYKFLDVDPLEAIQHSQLEPQEKLIKKILEMESCAVVVGGPMTGLAQLIMRNPAVAKKFTSVHAMFATWGRVKLMDFGEKPRGALQFNVACDPFAANYILSGLDCPIYLLTTEVTRVPEIGFTNAVELRNALTQNNGTRQLYNLYALWYDAAVKPRQDKNPEEKIFIHDLAPALALNADVREKIYEIVPINITAIPYLPNESADWGKILMSVASPQADHNRFAATGLKPDGAKEYLNILRNLFV
jgi:inosine-uridine nucleoside N-ribohydrolase